MYSSFWDKLQNKTTSQHQEDEIRERIRTSADEENEIGKN